MDTVREFTPDMQSFYSRHLMLSGFGFEAQGRLSAATAAVVGLGGLGCPAVSLLAAAGVGSLRLIDPDVVDMTNVLRQSLYLSGDAGKLKAQVAVERVNIINDTVKATAIPRPFEPDYLEDCDIVLDCTDSMASREAIARAARRVGIPVVHGAAVGYEGRMAVFEATAGSCLGCLLPDNATADTCGESGVFAPVTAMVGSWMAAEAIKRIAGIGTSPAGLVVYDGLSGVFHEFEIRRDPNCRICGDAKIREGSVPTISVAELAKKLNAREDFVLLDVRELHELAISRIDPCVHIPMNEVLWKSCDLPMSAEICVLCRTGNRSGTITQALRLRGFTNVRNVAGGINAYAQHIDPSMKTY